MPAFSVTYDNAIAVVTFDLPGESVNKLTAPVIREFEELMTQLRGNAGARAVVFISGKPDTFIAGADIEEFVKLQNRVEAEALSRKGQELMTLVEDFPRPVIAADTPRPGTSGTCGRSGSSPSTRRTASA